MNDILKGILIGSLTGLAFAILISTYINSEEIIKRLQEPVQQEMTIEEKIEKYKQFDQTHPADSLYFEQRYPTHTVTGTLL